VILLLKDEERKWNEEMLFKGQRGLNTARGMKERTVVLCLVELMCRWG